MFGIDVPYRQVQFFNLQKSFDLNDAQYEVLMKAGHLPENLLHYEETPGASEVINKWVDQGYRYNMTLAELYNMTFNFAVEDSPAAFEHVMHFDNCRIAVFDRPWNSRAELPNDRFVRCEDWQEIDRAFEIEKTENDL